MDLSGRGVRPPQGGEHRGPDENSVDRIYETAEAERRILLECNEESFWYRSLPFSAVSMIGTQVLIKKGLLPTNSRLGSFSKVAFAGFCGYLVGKVSYISICKEKFKRLENSSIRESIQHKHPLGHAYVAQKSDFTNLPSRSSFGSSPSTEAPLSSSYSAEYSSINRSLSNYEPIPFSASVNESSPNGITEHNASEPVPLLEESPKRRGVSYEELRNKNRETYEVALTQKAETPVKFSPERPFKEEVKVNKYGDNWEE